MGWLFNVDYESKLFSNNPHQKESSKLNQEFEYLLFFLNLKVATLKKYSDEYIKFGKKLSAFHFDITHDIQNSKNFWGKLENIDNEKYLNSKITSSNFAIEQGLAHSSTQIVNEVSDIPEGYLLKAPHGFSGRHILESGKPVKESGPFVLEKKLNRLRDFSCFNDGITRLYYENIVDKNFQYKGSSFDREHLQKPCIDSFNYHLGIDQVISEWGEGQYSIDSFSYLENAIEEVYVLCEVNYRKTFGWLSFQLADALVPDKKYFGSFLVNSKKFCPTYFDREELKKQNIFSLSPVENQFQVFIWGCDKLFDKEIIFQRFRGFY